MNKLRFLKPIGLLAVAAGFSVAVMFLWNWLMPVIFGLASISFWQAFGLLVLCKILFSSFHGGHHVHHERHHLREKWQKMTPEQRAEFVNKRSEHFGRGGFFGGHFETDENTPKEP